MHDSGLIRETAQTHLPSIEIGATLITKMMSSQIVERRQNHIGVGRSLDVREIVLEDVGPPLSFEVEKESNKAEERHCPE